MDTADNFSDAEKVQEYSEEQLKGKQMADNDGGEVIEKEEEDWSEEIGEEETTEEEEEEDEEEEEEEMEEEEVEDEETTEEKEKDCLALSLENRKHCPHRDRTESVSSVSTATARPQSYLHKENQQVVRNLVRKSIEKRKKQLQRSARGKKMVKPPTPAGRRSKKTNRTNLKQLLDCEW